jgi:hypothetical protein
MIWLGHAGIESEPGAERQALENAIDCFSRTLEIWTEEAYCHYHPKAKSALDRARTWLETGEDPGESPAD